MQQVLREHCTKMLERLGLRLGIVRWFRDIFLVSILSKVPNQVGLDLILWKLSCWADLELHVLQNEFFRGWFNNSSNFSSAAECNAHMGHYCVVSVRHWALCQNLKFLSLLFKLYLLLLSLARIPTASSDTGFI